MSFAVSLVFVTSFVQVSYKFRTSFAIPRTRRTFAADGHVFQREATMLGEFLSLLDKQTKCLLFSFRQRPSRVPCHPLLGFRPSPTVSPWPAVVVSCVRCFAVAAPALSCCARGTRQRTGGADGPRAFVFQWGRRSCSGPVLCLFQTRACCCFKRSVPGPPATVAHDRPSLSAFACTLLTD